MFLMKMSTYAIRHEQTRSWLIMALTSGDAFMASKSTSAVCKRTRLGGHVCVPRRFESCTHVPVVAGGVGDVRPRPVRERGTVGRRLDVGLEAQWPAVRAHEMALVVEGVEHDRGERLQAIAAHGLDRAGVVDVLFLRTRDVVRTIRATDGPSVTLTIVIVFKYSMRSESVDPKSLVISCVRYGRVSTSTGREGTGQAHIVVDEAAAEVVHAAVHARLPRTQSTP